METGAFGAYFQEKRMAARKTLRQFCQDNGFDPGNISKLERGLMAPPEAEDKLKEYAKALGLKAGSKDEREFFDLAALEKGRLPKDLADDKELLAKLPVLFRGIRGEKFSEEKLDALIKQIKDA
jgi:transcriptional regulator with XRE-family HTH domain